MDGNGRWAKHKQLKRTAGHEAGAKTVKTITEHCAKMGIKYLTLYAFSTENWNRPKLEVEFLMKLLEKYLKEQEKTYLENNIKFKAIGDLTKFSKKLQNTIQTIQTKTSLNTSLTQVLALNYGSKDEIVRSIQKIQEQNLELTQETITNNLDTKGLPDVDMLIRTSGEIRISNFMLWQCAYAEMFFTKTYWPDFNSDELDNMINEFTLRNRRFGAL
jgi:undecaprenyl diphosphate synthase